MTEAVTPKPAATRELIRNGRRLVGSMIRRYPGITLGIFFTASINAATPFARSGAIALLVNSLVSGGVGGALTHSQLVYVGIYAATMLVPGLTRTIGFYLRARLDLLRQEWLELEITGKQGQLDMARHEDKEFADLFNRVLENAVWRSGNFFSRWYDIFGNILIIILACIAIGWSQWLVLVVLLVATIPELLAEGRYGQRIYGIHNLQAETKRKYYSLRGHFYNLGNLVELKLFQNVPHFLGQMRAIFSGINQLQRNAEGSKARERTFVRVLAQGAVGFAAYAFASRVIGGQMQVGTLVFLLTAVTQLHMGLADLFSALGMQYQDSLYISDLFRYLDTEPVVRVPVAGVRLAHNATPDIEFEHVTFTYPGTHAPVLEDFSLSIPAGRKLAIVGINGAGKTTLIKLLCRFYDPDKGRILVGGCDLRELDLDSWYAMLGALFQDYARYHMLVRDAIAVGRTGSEPDIEKVKATAKAAEADEFISAWEKSYGQQLGKNFTEGVEPSVGQWQKLALARMFYRDPRVLILDEPTASIDAEAEAKIFESIEALPSDRTTLMISHRFSTVRRADEIVVIDNGRVLEQGSHDALMAKDGTYARLFRLQAKGYQE